MWFLIPGLLTGYIKRVCPKCGKPQLVPRKDRDEKVRCKHCGAEIKPDGRDF